MCVCDPNRLPALIYRRNTTPTETGFAKIVSHDFPILPS
jgi:hypothetical protein